MADSCRRAILSAQLRLPASRRGGASGRCAAQITDYLQPIIAQRRREPRDDVVSALAMADADGHRLTDEEILAHIRLLFSAGASTTTDALGNLSYALLSERQRWERLLAEPALRGNAIEELLRWETPVAVLPRLCPGMHLARRQLAVALDVLMERLPDLHLLDADAARPRGAILRGPARLPVAW